MRLTDCAELVFLLEEGRLTGSYKALALAADTVVRELEENLWIDRLGAEVASLAERARAARDRYAHLLRTRSAPERDAA